MGEVIRLLRMLVNLAQERNTLALESLAVLRDIHEDLDEIGPAQAKQIELLTKIAAELVPPPPPVLRPLKRTIMLFGSIQK
jgi:hypothetical protein